MKQWMKVRLGQARAAKSVVVGSLVASASMVPMFARAQASGVDFTSLTSSVDFGSAVLAVMAVAAALVLLYVAMKGAKIVLNMIRGA